MPTEEQYGKAILLAQRAGDKEAAQALMDELSTQLTGPANFMGKLGAGFTDIGLAGKQLLGQTTPDEIKQHNQIANMATGGTIGGHLTRALPLAMTALLPGGQGAAGAAGYGALAGILSPTEDENVVQGKLAQAGLGALTGGAFQGAANLVAPKVMPVLKKALGRVGEYFPGGAQRAAQRDFVNTIPEGERAAAEQALRGASAARQAPLAAGTSGAPISTAAALGSAAPKGQYGEGTARLLAAEREAREAGGMLGQPFRNLDEAAAQARWEHLDKNVGGDVGALKRDANDVYENFILNTKMKKDFDPGDRLWREMQTALTNEDNPAVKTELERIAKQYLSAKGRGDFQSLHATRMEAFDDSLKRLYSTDTKAAGRLRSTINEFEDIFDKEMEKSLGSKGKWAQFREDYSKAKTAVSQAEEGEKFLGTARTWNETPGGVPGLTGKRQQMGALADKVDDYGRPLVSPEASDALQTVRREIGEQMLPGTVGPKGAATAQNLNPSSPVLARAMAAQKRANAGLLTPWNAGVAAVSTGLGNPMLGAGIVGGRMLLDRRALGIANELMKIYADPHLAAQALAKSQLSQSVKTSVLAELAKRVGAQSAASAGGQMNEPQEQ